MKKRRKESWISVTAMAFIADAISKGTPRGTLGRKHAEKIALRYALKSRAIYRKNQLKKFLMFSGAIGLIVFVIANWQ